jgi:hypothetical protein
MGVGGATFVWITGAVEAVKLFVSNWDKINAWMNDLPSPEQMQAKIEAQKAQQEKLKTVLGGVTPEAAAVGTEAQKALTMLGGPKVQQDLEQSLIGSMPGWDEQRKEKFRQDQAGNIRRTMSYTDSSKLATAPEVEAHEKAANAQAEVKRLLEHYTDPGPVGDAARARVKAIIAANPGRFPAGTIAALEAAQFPADAAAAMETEWEGLKPPGAPSGPVKGGDFGQQRIDLGALGAMGMVGGGPAGTGKPGQILAVPCAALPATLKPSERRENRKKRARESLPIPRLPPARSGAASINKLGSLTRTSRRPLNR